MFLSTPPSRVATSCKTCKDKPSGCFYPRHPRGWRQVGFTKIGNEKRFYPRHPRGWRPFSLENHAVIERFLSTLPSRVATFAKIVGSRFIFRFYPRHPRGWRRGSRCGAVRLAVFLSTPPSRVATLCLMGRFRVCECFYPRHPRGWRLLPAIVCLIAMPNVSIHATLAGGDVFSFHVLHEFDVSIHATLAGGDGHQ